MDESTGKNSSGKHKDKSRSKNPGKNAHNAHMRGKPSSSSKHPHKKRPHPPGESGMKRVATPGDSGKKRAATTPSHPPPPPPSSSSRRLDDMRLVLESTPSDEELAKKVRDVVEELDAVDRARADEGTYLGIVDKGELEKRRHILVQRRYVLREERDLGQKIRVQVEVEERAAAERRERQASSSPASKSSSGNKNGGTKSSVTTAQQSSPSARVPAAPAAQAPARAPARPPASAPAPARAPAVAPTSSPTSKPRTSMYQHGPQRPAVGASRSS
ncbi:unnamed protein product [Ectocarpus fasciculatus]